METASSDISSSPQLKPKSFGKKNILIVISAFILGGLIGLFGSKILFLKGWVPLSKEPAVRTEELLEPTVPVVSKGILMGEFQPPPETNASPKILYAKKKISQRPDQPTVFGPEERAVFDPTTEQSSPIPLQTIRSEQPLLSPTHRWIAYINYEDGNIWILDTDGKNKTKVSSQAIAETELFWGTEFSLNGWSSDEEWLVYYVSSVSGGIGSDPEEKLEPSVARGYYAANLKEGTVYLLPNLPNFGGFLPKSDLIVFEKDKQEGEQRQTDFYTYDLIAGKVERLTKESITGIPFQFSFSSDKRHFAYIASGEKRDLSSLIYASLDNVDKRELAKARQEKLLVERFRNPQISPDGMYIAYQKEITTACPGPEGKFGTCDEFNLIIYDLEANQEKNLGQVNEELKKINRISYWFDNNRLVVLKGTPPDPISLQIVDISTSLVKTISDDVAF